MFFLVCTYTCISFCSSTSSIVFVSLYYIIYGFYPHFTSNNYFQFTIEKNIPSTTVWNKIACPPDGYICQNRLFREQWSAKNSNWRLTRIYVGFSVQVNTVYMQNISTHCKIFSSFWIYHDLYSYVWVTWWCGCILLHKAMCCHTRILFLDHFPSYRHDHNTSIRLGAQSLRPVQTFVSDVWQAAAMFICIVLHTHCHWYCHYHVVIKLLKYWHWYMNIHNKVAICKFGQGGITLFLLLGWAWWYPLKWCVDTQESYVLDHFPYYRHSHITSIRLGAQYPCKAPSPCANLQIGCLTSRRNVCY